MSQKSPQIENPEEFYEDFLQKSLGELKDYLSLRGLSVTRKKESLPNPISPTKFMYGKYNAF